MNSTAVLSKARSIAVAIIVFASALVASGTRLQAQGCEMGCDTVPPQVIVVFATASLPLDTITVTWCDDVSLGAGSRSITLNGADVTGSFSYSAIAGSCTANAQSKGAFSLNAGTTYTVFATIQDGAGNLGTGSEEYTAPNGWVTVDPKGLSITKPQQSTGFSQSFTVTNLASTAANFRLVRTCLNQVSGCGTVPDTVHINGGASSVVAVTYQTGNTSGTGTLRLRARLTTDSTIADSTDVTVTPVLTMIVDASPNNNDAQDMRLCAYSCFGNIYRQNTVPYFSLDQPRGVTLVWNSLRSWFRPYLHFDLSFLAGSPTVTRIELQVKDSATNTAVKVMGDHTQDHKGIVYYSRNTGSVVRIGTYINDDTWLPANGTGIHPLSIKIIAVHASFSDTVNLTVPLLIVREPPGSVARGWYVEGTQRLIPVSGGRMLVTEADGSAFVFTPSDTAGNYTSPPGELSRFTRVINSGVKTYVRAYPDSSKVRFDSVGKMLNETDSWGNSVRYAYDGSGRPTRIYDPFRTRPDSTAAPSAYTEINYSGTNVEIRPPQGDGSSYDASRVTILRLNTDTSLRAIKDPDGDSTRFTYKNAMPFPLNNRPTFIENLFDRNGTQRGNFNYETQGTMWLFNGPNFPADFGNGNTSNSWQQFTFFDWRGKGIPGGVTSTSSLAASANVDTIRSEVRDPSSHQTFTRHDYWGQPLDVITHNKQDTTTFYRTELYPDSIRSPMGTVDRFRYDLVAGGRRAPIWSWPAGQDSISLEYDTFGQVSRVSGPRIATQDIRRHGNPAKIDTMIVAGAFTTAYEYDAVGRMKRTIDPKAHTTEIFFDGKFGNTQKTLQPGVRFDSVLFDRYGRDSVVSSTAAARRFFLYDVLNRPSRDSLNGEAGATVYGYDREFLVRVVDPKGQVFKREVNVMGWTRKVFSPADTTRYVRHEYTNEGLQTYYADSMSTYKTWKTMSYGNNNRHLLTSTSTDSTSNGASYGFGFRMSGNVRTGTFTVGSNWFSTDTVWADVYGRPDSVITRITGNTSSGLNSAIGQRRYVRRYTWTNDHLPASLSLETRQAGTGALIKAFKSRSFVWDSLTRALNQASVDTFAVATVRNYEAMDSTWQYNFFLAVTKLYTARHELWSSTYTNPAVDSLFSRGYAYVDTIAGRVKQINWFASGNFRVRQLRYAPQGDLSWVNEGATACGVPEPSVTELDGWACDPSFTSTRTLGIEYDLAHNLRKQVDSVGAVTDTAVVTTGNRLTNWGTKSYTFNGSGQMTSRTNGAGTVNFTYDVDGQLRRVIAGSDTTCYEYNAFGQLAFRGTTCKSNYQQGTVVRKVGRVFVWDGDQLIAEVDSTASKRLAEYAYFPGIDRPLALITDSTGGTTVGRMYHQDALGNVLGLTRVSAVDQTLDYEPWGELKTITGTVADTNRLRWKGLIWDGGNTNLYYVRNRWYDPEARRFTTQDPIGIDGGINLYNFAGNDWPGGSDPSGLQDCKPSEAAKGLCAYPLGPVEIAPEDPYRAIGFNPFASDRGGRPWQRIPIGPGTAGGRTPADATFVGSPAAREAVRRRRDCGIGTTVRTAMAGGMTARAVGAAYGAVAFGEKGASIGGVAVGVAAGVALGPEAAPAGYYAGRIGGLVVGMGYGAWRLGRIGTAAGVVLGAAESLAICR